MRTLLLALALVGVTAAIGAALAVVNLQTSARTAPVTAAGLSALPASASSQHAGSTPTTHMSLSTSLAAPTTSSPVTRAAPVTRPIVPVPSTASLGPPDSAFEGIPLAIAAPDQFAVTESPSELRYSFTGPLAVYVSYTVSYVGGQGCTASNGTWLGQRRGQFSAGNCTDLVGARMIFTPTYRYTYRGVTAVSFTIDLKTSN
jgi:hypothetical protein